MELDINELEKQALNKINEAKNLAELEQIRIEYLGRKSKLVLFLRSLKDLPKQEIIRLGKISNETRRKLESGLKEKREGLKQEEVKKNIGKEKLDITAPGKRILTGHLHPLTTAFRDATRIFNQMGFHAIEGPEIESEWYNFDALNFPKNHSSRDLMDTFWIKDAPKIQDVKNQKALLRTHTSPMQVRFMEKHNPPLRIIVPGRVFRHEATDASHEMQFYQLEGFMVEKNISLANLKGVLEYFYKQFFKTDIEIKFVQGYFPFVEPGVEVLMRNQAGKWLEVSGAGMIHQNVFKAAGYVPGQWTGFAFGMGIDRLAMLKYKINDIRLFYGGDLRFLKQF